MSLRKGPFSVVFIMMSWMLASTPVPAEAPSSSKTDTNFRLPLTAVTIKTQPRTAEEVRASYQALVRTADGIDRLEARILAQYILLRRDRKQDFDVAKPLIIGETAEEWVVRFPPRFSLTRAHSQYQLVIRLRKSNGDILSYGEEPFAP